MAGRPTICTPELTERVCDGLRKGLSISSACGLAGLGLSTYHQWRAMGEDGTQPYADFADATTRAQAEAEDRVVGYIEDGIPEDPHAAIKWYGMRWGPAAPPSRKVQVELKVDLSRLTDEELAEMERIRRKLES